MEKEMRYLTDGDLEKLTIPRLRALLKKVNALVGSTIDEYFDFEPNRLFPEDARLNEYRKNIRRIISSKRQ
jgi:hypothetical protein